MSAPSPPTSNTASPRRNGRPMRLGGGPRKYFENALAAVAQPLKGITTRYKR